ncbi:MAG: PAS domain S-box protein, partial [Methylovulum sp.]
MCPSHAEGGSPMRSDEPTEELTVSNRALRAQIAEYQRAEKALRESEARYRALVSEVSDGLFVVDARGVITFANRSLA